MTIDPTAPAPGTDQNPAVAQAPGAPDAPRDAGSDPGPAAPAGKAAARAAAKAVRRAEKAASREARLARRAAKRAAKAARQAAKAARRAERRAEDAAAARERAILVDGRDRRGAEAKGRRAAGTRRPVMIDSPVPERRLGERAGEMAAAAGGVLSQVADLVRQAAEPAASRIVERVTARPEPNPASAPELARPDPAPAAASAPEPAAAPELELAPEPEPAVAPAPEAELDAAAAGQPASEPGNASAAVIEAVADTGSPAEPTVVIPADAVIGAAVDVGANSVHLLVAAVDGRRVIPLVDESVFLGLGDRVAAHGILGAVARDELALALATYAETSRRLGARDITFLGTEPIRRAADAPALVREVAIASGVPLHVLDHHEEAILNLLGVTMGGAIDHDMLVVDIGGGSSEVIVAGPGRRVVTVGLRTGSARLTHDHLHEDPPTSYEIHAMREAARRVVAGTPVVSSAELVAVGGTASNLVRVLAEAAVDRTLTHDRLSAALALLAVEPSADIAVRHLLRPTRARILPAGAVILDAILERCGADRIRVVDTGIREGAVLAAAVAGHAWRDRLEMLAAGWDE